jgi:ubiquitin C-terminal hydrolase
MAVVAFPFTCFTSDEIDDDFDSLQQPYASSPCRKDHEPQLDEDCAALASAKDEDLSDCSFGPCTEPKEAPNEDVIDDMIDEAMDEDESDTNPIEAEDPAGEILTMEMETETPADQIVKLYGGLTNLGNTCFMNSALQMLASLDRFKQVLESEPAAESHKPELRLAFLEVLASLEQGNTTSTSGFKKALDERTSLFLGYHQEDSHEFLTTLLDLLDADYRESKDAKMDSEQEEGNSDDRQSIDEIDNEDPNDMEAAEQDDPTSMQEEVNTSEPIDDDSSCKPAVEAVDDKETTAIVMETENGEDEAVELSLSPTQSLDSCEPAAKKPRSLDEEQPVTNSLKTVTKSKSFSDLQPDGIEELLNARLLVDNNSEVKTVLTPPKCKLAGGRMTSPEPSVRSLVCKSETSEATASKETKSEEQDEEDSGAPMSPVDKYFQTEVRVRLTCESCKYTRTHRENFLHLSLEIGADGNGLAGNVEDGLRKFFSPEKREIKCEKCFCPNALQTMEITRLPVALLLHFKRFIVDISDDYTSITYRKNQSDVIFDETLDLKGVLSEFVANDISLPEDFEGSNSTDRHYHIRSVVNHIGSSAACGHYTADALRSYTGEGRRWNRFNDSYVTDISDDAAVRNSTKTALCMS